MPFSSRSRRLQPRLIRRPAPQYNTKRARGRSPAEVVESLEQQLQEWLNVLPPHLQWDPNQPEDTWFRQAVDLHLQYNIVLVRPACDHSRRSLLRLTKAPLASHTCR